MMLAMPSIGPFLRILCGLDQSLLALALALVCASIASVHAKDDFLKGAAALDLDDVDTGDAVDAALDLGGVIGLAF